MSINWTKTPEGFEATVSTGKFIIERKSGRFILKYGEYEQDNNGKHDRVMVGSLTACRQKVEEMVAEREVKAEELTGKVEGDKLVMDPGAELKTTAIPVEAWQPDPEPIEVMVSTERRTQPSKAPAYCYPPTLDALMGHLRSRAI